MSEKILLVDDDESNLSLLTGTEFFSRLRSENHSVPEYLGKNKISPLLAAYKLNAGGRYKTIAIHFAKGSSGT